MTEVFADAFYYFALLNPKDPAHSRATDFSAIDPRPVVTGRWILLEVADGLARSPSGRQVFAQLIQDLESRPEVRILPLSDDLFAAGVELYSRRPDKGWSLTDCVSFVVMRREGITEALTGDRHFEQAGFAPLLK
jgi:predicted nucleic acid-binding protein